MWLGSAFGINSYTWCSSLGGDRYHVQMLLLALPSSCPEWEKKKWICGVRGECPPESSCPAWETYEEAWCRPRARGFGTKKTSFPSLDSLRAVFFQFFPLYHNHFLTHLPFRCLNLFSLAWKLFPVRNKMPFKGHFEERLPHRAHYGKML